MHFYIRYHQDTKDYYLKDSGQGIGTFVKVDRPLVNNISYIIIGFEGRLFDFVWRLAHGR